MRYIKTIDDNAVVTYDGDITVDSIGENVQLTIRGGSLIVKDSIGEGSTLSLTPYPQTIFFDQRSKPVRSSTPPEKEGEIIKLKDKEESTPTQNLGYRPKPSQPFSVAVEGCIAEKVSINTTKEDIRLTGKSAVNGITLKTCGGDIIAACSLTNALISTFFYGSVKVQDIAKTTINTTSGHVFAGNIDSESHVSTQNGGINAQKVSSGAKLHTFYANIRAEEVDDNASLEIVHKGKKVVGGEVLNPRPAKRPRYSPSPFY